VRDANLHAKDEVTACNQTTDGAAAGRFGSQTAATAPVAGDFPLHKGQRKPSIQSIEYSQKNKLAAPTPPKDIYIFREARGSFKYYAATPGINRLLVVDGC